MRRLFLVVVAVAALGAAVYFAVPALIQPGTVEGNKAPLAERLERAATGPMAKFEVITPPEAMADIRFEDAAGKQLTLSDFSGKWVLLNFWATWCAPCVEEMPSLDSLQAQLGSDRFQVVAISLDKNGRVPAQDFLGRIGAKNLGFYIDPSARAGVAAGVTGMPTTFLIDPQGRKVGVFVGPADWAAPAARNLIVAAAG